MHFEELLGKKNKEEINKKNLEYPYLQEARRCPVKEGEPFVLLNVLQFFI